MTVDELIFAISELQSLVFDKEQALEAIDVEVARYNKNMKTNGMVADSLHGALESIYKAPVVSLDEYRSIRDGIVGTRKNRKEINEKMNATAAKRRPILKELEALNKQLHQLEHDFSEVETGMGTLLEFKQ